MEDYFIWTCSCGNENADEYNFCSKCGAAKNDGNWYFVYNGSKHGPYTIEQMQKAVVKRYVNAETLVWTNGFLDWTAAKNTQLVQFISNVVPPLRISDISDKWLWSLAIIPLLVDILLPLFGVNDSLISILTVIVLNTAFIILDNDNLEKCEIDTKGWFILGFILVPLYIFLRAKNTNKNYGCLLVWCGLFILSIFL